MQTIMEEEEELSLQICLCDFIIASLSAKSDEHVKEKECPASHFVLYKI